MKLGPKTQLIWHGGSQAAIASIGALLLIKDWPTPYQWLILGAAGVLACIKGIDSLLTRREDS